MSVDGADHRIAQCNHLTLFGSAVSVVEFPPHRKFLCWMVQKFPVRSCFTVCRLCFCPASPALKALREDRYHWVRTTPLSSGEKDISFYFLLEELIWQFKNSASSAEIADIQAAAAVTRFSPCLAPFWWREDSTFFKLGKKQSEGWVFGLLILSWRLYIRASSFWRQLHRIFAVRFSVFVSNY